MPFSSAGEMRIDTRRRLYASYGGFAALYVLLATLNTWPLAAQLTSHLPHDLGDPVVSLTLLQWNTAVPIFSERWWNGIGFYPLEDTLTLSDTRIGLTLLGWPVKWATGSAVTMHNVLFILSFALSAFSMHALVFALTRSHRGALVAGCAFGFAPFRAAHLAHLELLASYWMPVALLSLHRWLETRRWRWLVAAAAAIAAQGLFCAYYLPMLGVLVGLWLLWFAVGRIPLRSLAAAVVAVAAGAGALLPLFLYYKRAHEKLGFARGLGEIEAFSADLSGLWSIPHELALWPTVEAKNAEGYLFPGLTVVAVIASYLWITRVRRPDPVSMRRARRWALAALALVAIIASVVLLHGPIRWSFAGLTLSVSHLRKPVSLMIAAFAVYVLLQPRVVTAARARSVIGFYVLATAAMLMLSLGPNPTILGVKFLYKAPYAWLMELPGFDTSLRAPARFGMLAALTLGVASGLAWARVGHLGSSRHRWALTGLVAALIVSEGWAAPSKVLLPPAGLTWPSRCATIPRLELPFTDIEHDAAAQYRAMRDGVRSVNGTSGFIPPHMLILESTLKAGEADALGALAEYGPLCIALDPSASGGNRLASWLPRHPLVQRLAASSGRSFFVLNRRTLQDVAPSSDALTIAEATSSASPVDLGSIQDGRPETGWLASPAQQRDEQLTLALACNSHVTDVTLVQGGYAPSYPRVLTIEVIGRDGRAVQVWHGAPGALFLRAALRRPREVSATFPVEMSNVRHIRLSATGRDPDVGWGMADVVLSGRCAGEPAAP